MARYKNALKDTLHNLCLDENNNFNISQDQKMYYQGLIVGMVATLMYQGLTFDKALNEVKLNLPKNHIDFDKFLPTCW